MTITAQIKNTEYAVRVIKKCAIGLGQFIYIFSVEMVRLKDKISKYEYNSPLKLRIEKRINAPVVTPSASLEKERLLPWKICTYKIRKNTMGNSIIFKKNSKTETSPAQK